MLDALEKEGIVAEYSCPKELLEHVFTNLSYNSKEVCENTLFICKGMVFKEEYLLNAIKDGACAYLSQERYEGAKVPYVRVTNIRRAMAVVSNLFYGQAFREMTLIGLTGTKGKTSTTYFLKNILDRYYKQRTAVLSTVEVYTGVEDHDAHLTTPESPDLHKYFAQTRDSGIPVLTMEVSSQAYKMDRVYGVDFDIGLFLNFGEDHIGPMEHEDIEDYFNCKLQLMKHCKTIVINRNTDRFEQVYEAARSHAERVILCGTDDSCDYWVSDIQKEKVGFTFTIHGKDGYQKRFAISMAGRFNAENALAAFCIAKVLGADDESIAQGLFASQVRGRMNVFENEKITVIVDFAHNYLSLSKLFESIKEDYPNRRVVVVVGSQGGKSYGRRREIGTLTGRYADYAYLTADDPQFESVTEICKEIASYMEPYHTPYEIIEDRKTAVETAILKAHEGDVVLLAAKGEEVYLKIRGQFVDYESDLAIAKRCLNITQ